MDNFLNHQPSPPEDFTPAFAAPKRQPNLGYAVALLCIGFLVLVVLSIVLAVAGHSFGVSTHAAIAALGSKPKLSILLEAATFALTLGIAYLLFPRFWFRSFGETIDWNAATVRPIAVWLAGTGIATSITAQLLESRLTLPPQMPIDEFFKHPSDVWIVAIFGALLAPIFEEIFFRGFLLRGFAIFIDWIMLPKTEAAQLWWVSTDQLTRRAMILSGILTSGLFAGMHAAQLGFAWSAVGLLWLVGGVLTYVRLRFNSVAASALTHAVYNGWIFVVLFVVTGGFRHLETIGNH